MRILLVNKYYPPHVGGIEFHVRDLAEALARAGHEVRVLVCNESGRHVVESVNGVEVVRCKRAFEKASTPVSFEFRRMLDKYAAQADIVHFHFPYPYGEFEWLRSKAFLNTPYVVTYHTDIVRQKFALAVYRPYLEQFLDGAARIMASSPQLIEYSDFLSRRSHKCEQVNFGLPVEHIAHNTAAKKRAVELRASLDARPIVLFVGRFVYYKGVEVLIDSMPLVDAEYVAIGSGPLKTVMEERARELGVCDRLHIIDYAADEELIAWYHAADVLALPSVLPSEAFGLVQIEAHAAGTPTVSTLLESGVPYANLDGVTGFSVEVGSSHALAVGLNEILLDAPLKKKLGEQAQRRALSEFTIDAMVEKVSEVYRGALRR
ncbi:MAG: glycosyltransferase [Coriobacteriia bacterium]|nr:glycosyltransferase [Coriobacteriia bacterium]